MDNQTNGKTPTGPLALDVTNLPTLADVERQYLTLVLDKVGGNKVQAAKVLGLSVKTIYNKLDSYKAPNETAEIIRTSP